jgi:hypothetical protein
VSSSLVYTPRRDNAISKTVLMETLIDMGGVGFVPPPIAKAFPSSPRVKAIAITAKVADFRKYFVITLFLDAAGCHI